MAPRTQQQQQLKQRQDDLRRQLAELARDGKTWHVIEEGLCGRGEGRLVLRLGADKAALVPIVSPAPGRRKRDPALPAAWYFRYTDPAGKRPWLYIGVCDPARKAGLDLDDALYEARKLSELLQGPAGGDLVTYLANEQRRKQHELEGQRRLEAQKDKTLRSLLDTYIQWLRDQGKDRSAYDTANLLGNHLFKPWPELCAKPAAQVSRDELADVVRAITKGAKRRAAGKFRSFVSAAYEAALRVADNVEVPAAFRSFGIEHNPMAAVKYKGAGIRERKRKVAPHDLGRLLVLLRKEQSMAAKALRILIDLGGQRQQQLWRVPLADVDLDAWTLQQLDPKGSRSTPRVHQVPLVGRTRHQVAALVKAARRRGTPLLFSTDGKVPIRDETVRELFRSLAQKVCALNDAATPAYSLGNVRCTVESQLGDWDYTRQHRGWLLSHGFSGVQAQHYELIEADRKLREMLCRWQGHLLRLERNARKDIRKRADEGDPRFVALLEDLAAGKPARARVHGADTAGADHGVTQLSVVASNQAADPLLRIRDILELIPISKSTLTRLRASGEFPPESLQIKRTPLWYRSQVDAFIAQAMVQQHRRTPRPPPRLQLVGG
jgi:predicted DNA-binding transcriptional regulator AlpA